MEIKLREINNIKIRGILEKNSNFDTLHSERVTPLFLKMARGSQSSASMTEICNYDGTRFANNIEQKTFIRTHFANSFKKPEDELDDLSDASKTFWENKLLSIP